MLHFARIWENAKAEGIVMRSSIPLQDLPFVENKGRDMCNILCNNTLVSFLREDSDSAI